MYRRYYKETPPGYSGVAFTREDPKEEARETSTPRVSSCRVCSSVGEALDALSCGCAAEEERTYSVPAGFSCTKQAVRQERAALEKEGCDGPSPHVEALSSQTAKSGEKTVSGAGGVSLFKRAFTLEDILLAVLALLLISGEVEEESLLLLGLVLVLVGK